MQKGTLSAWRSICFLIIGAVTVHGQTVKSSQSLSFAQACEMILAHNGALKSAQTHIQAAQAGRDQASVFLNPKIGVALDGFGANEIEVTVEQAIELGGKGKLRTTIAQQEVDAAKNGCRLAQVELEIEIVRRFIPIFTGSQKLSLLDSIIAITELTKEQIKKRVDAGATKRTDLVRAEIDIEQLTLTRSELFRETEQAKKKFAALGGQQAPALFAVTGEVVDETEVPSLDVLRTALFGNPQLTAIDIEQQRMDTQQKQLGADVVPDINLSAGYLRNNVDNSNSPLVGISMSLPLFNRNSAAQKQVGLERTASQERRDNTHRLLDAELEDVHSTLLELDKKIAVLRTSAIPKTEHVYSMIQEYYIAGSAGFADLKAAQAEMLNLRMSLLDAQMQRAKYLTDLMQITSIYLQIVK